MPRSGTRRNSVVASSSGLINGVLGAAILALSARRGQTSEIAAYTVVTAALGFVAIAVGGGSSILYMSGDPAQRRGVRSQWIFFVLPSLIVGTVLIGLFYSRDGYPWAALLAAGVVVVANSLVALQLGDLAREMRYSSGAIVVCGSKFAALFLVLDGMRLTMALLIGGVIQFVLAEIVLRRTSWLRPGGLRRLSPSSGLSVYRTNTHLFAYSASELYNGRIGTLVLSFFVTPQIMGCYGAIASAYQSLGGVLCSALQVSLVAKARVRHGIDARGTYHRDAEFISIGGATLIVVCTSIAAPLITGHILRLPIHESALWLRIIVVALPFMVFNRAATFTAIGDGDYRRATRIVLLVAMFATPVIAFAVPLFGPVGAAGASLGAEAATTVFVVAGMLRRRRRPTRVQGGRHSASSVTAAPSVPSTH